jgi:dolichol-phosphate mannosyltransferase
MSGLSGPIRLSVAAPAYNEAEGIAAVVMDWHGFLATQSLADFEIVICNDGSADETGAILDQLALA